MFLLRAAQATHAVVVVEARFQRLYSSNGGVQLTHESVHLELVHEANGRREGLVALWIPLRLMSWPSLIW